MLPSRGYIVWPSARTIVASSGVRICNDRLTAASGRRPRIARRFRIRFRIL
jgi:hypothetical protein